MTEKLIITIAPTGSMPRKRHTPHVPVTTQEIVADALQCEEAGAAILHIHTRDEEQNPSDDPDRFVQVVEALAGRSNLILQISTGGRAGVTLESRRARLAAGGEMASLTTGSVNFPNSAYVNPPDLIDGLAAEMIQRSIKPEVEVFDLAMLHNGIALMERGLIPPPLHFNFVMGLKGAMPARVEHLVHLVGFLPPGSTWTVSGVGAGQLPMAVHAILMGGHVRVGLEDNIYFTKGELATNRMLVERIVQISRVLGREVATPDEARTILGLKPRSRDGA
jgi:3-keto-5-aminohexanoate cleavage enzyme